MGSMKNPLLAAMAAVLVSSALVASPAAAATTSTSEAVPPTSQIQLQPADKSSSGQFTTLGMGSGAKTFWCMIGFC